jgi:hypothetical protein
MGMQQDFEKKIFQGNMNEIKDELAHFEDKFAKNIQSFLSIRSCIPDLNLTCQKRFQI